MFYTPKPKQFHYRPRFFDPEKEEWEAKVMKYRMENEKKSASESHASTTVEAGCADATDDKDLAYFQRRVRDIDRSEREARQRLTFSDLFRRREKPTFHYVSRFDENGNIVETPATATKNAEVKRRMQRRFDNEDDWDRFKPIPAGKIMLSTLLVCLLLFFIFS